MTQRNRVDPLRPTPEEVADLRSRSGRSEIIGRQLQGQSKLLADRVAALEQQVAVLSASVSDGTNGGALQAIPNTGVLTVLLRADNVTPVRATLTPGSWFVDFQATVSADSANDTPIGFYGLVNGAAFCRAFTQRLYSGAANLSGISTVRWHAPLLVAAGGAAVTLGAFRHSGTFGARFQRDWSWDGSIIARRYG